MKGTLALAFVLTLAVATCAAGSPRLTELPQGERAARIAADTRSVIHLRAGLRRAVEFAGSRPDLFPAAKLDAPRLPAREQREALLGTWKGVLDLTLALDSIGRFHESFALPGAADRGAAYTVHWASFLARYRAALEFIALAERNPGLATVLDEPVPDLGLPAGTYARYKFLFLNVAAAARYGALKALEAALLRQSSPLRPGIEQDARAVLALGVKEGQILTAKNALQILSRTGFEAFFPVQAGVSEWMGDTKVRRVGRELVTPAQVREVLALLRPGDILLERREWYLSNIGLPGFWPHAALYVGTPAERRSLFAAPEARAWARGQGAPDGEVETLLRRRHPAAHALAVAAGEDGHLPRVLEAMSEGVVFTTLEHSASCDSLAVLRPRLPPAELAAAIVRAFGYAGRPYDFNFDFLTDAALVCTELVYKAYEPTSATRGLTLPLSLVMGRTVTTANDIARQFDEQCDTPAQQTDLVIFLDGVESAGKAVAAPLAEFRGSWRRPKWHLLIR